MLAITSESISMFGTSLISSIYSPKSVPFVSSKLVPFVSSKFVKFESSKFMPLSSFIETVASSKTVQLS